jgi:uncharacterized protein (TIGR04255 family)
MLDLMDDSDPSTAPPPAEVPLARAPLVRVIAQIKFPLVVAIEQRDFVAPFQEAVRASYPRLRQEQAVGFMLGPGGVVQVPAPQKVWRFSDEDDRWRLSLAPDFLSLETVSYSSRSDFLNRFRSVVSVLEKHVQPTLLDRLGVRYIDRISGGAIHDIEVLVRPEIRGLTGTAASANLHYMLTESVFKIGEAKLLAKWGQLPEGATTDPSAIEPEAARSWILDLDMFKDTPMPFNVDRVIDDVERFAERIYTFFRWAVTAEFLERYGGV